MNHICSEFVNIKSNSANIETSDENKEVIAGKQLKRAVRKQMSVEAIGSPGCSYTRKQAGLWLSSSWTEIALKIAGLALIGALAGGLMAAGLAPDVDHLSASDLEYQWENILYSSLYGAAVGAGLGFLIYLVAKVTSHFNPYINDRLKREIELEKSLTARQHNENYARTLDIMSKLASKSPSQNDLLGGNIVGYADSWERVDYYGIPDSPAKFDTYINQVEIHIEQLRKEAKQLIAKSPGFYLGYSWTRVAAIIVGLAVVGGLIGGAITYLDPSAHDLAIFAKLLLAAKQSVLWIAGGAAVGALGCLIAKIASACTSRENIFVERIIQARIVEIFDRHPTTDCRTRYRWHLEHHCFSQNNNTLPSLKELGKYTFVIEELTPQTCGRDPAATLFWQTTKPTLEELQVIKTEIVKERNFAIGIVED